MPEQRRVVVTGLGAVTPVGNSVPQTWTNLLAGCSGIVTITLFDASAFGVRIGGEVKNFKPEELIPSKELPHGPQLEVCPRSGQGSRRRRRTRRRS